MSSFKVEAEGEGERGTEELAEGKAPSGWFAAVRRFRGEREPNHRQYGIARSVYVRGLGAIYCAAILSWWVQLDGLVGEKGILPATPEMASMAAFFEAEGGRFLGGAAARFWKVPTLTWIFPGDGGLHFLCGAGVVLAVAVMAGWGCGPFLLLLWMIYLSLVTTGGVFMGFQWDSLLLEAGILAPLFAPWRWRPRLRLRARRDTPEVSRWVLFLHRWLLFRLMFFSGFVKLASGDETWRSLKALQFHYETQPIPNWVAWFAHQLPDEIHWWSCAIMFGIELGFPFLIFLGRYPRLVAASGFAFLNVLIILTGNYTYFNYLTILLCVPLVDDAFWPRVSIRRRVRKGAQRRERKESQGPAWLVRGRRWGGGGVRLMLGGFLFFLSVLVTYRQLGLQRDAFPGWVREIQRFEAPFRMVNGYGLFAVMTTSRPEIEIEGSLDGEEWRTYRFRWKAGDLEARPRFVAPHQPRLDWQMWFEALAAERGIFDFDRESWFKNFLFRLLEGSEPVLDLLEEDPFPGQAPRYLRARVFDYRFTDLKERKGTGHWWARRYSHDYVPSASLRK